MTPIEQICRKFDAARSLLVEFPDSETLLFELLGEMIHSDRQNAYMVPLIVWDFANKFRMVRWNGPYGIAYSDPTEKELPGWAAFRKEWEPGRGPINIMGALAYLSNKFTAGGTIVLLDATEYLNLQNDVGIGVRRLMKGLIDRCMGSGAETDGQVLVKHMRFMLVSGQAASVPEDMRIYLEKLTFELPTAEEISYELQQHMAVLSGDGQTAVPDYASESWRDLCRAALGLTRREAGDTFREAMLISGDVGDTVAQALHERKVQNAKALGLTVPAPPKNPVGGLDRLQRWLDLRRDFFYTGGDFRPKGILAVGPPGTGKSQLAKCASERLGMLIFGLQADSVFGSLVGESEAKMRRILNQAEANSPCILWIDEIEQMFSAGGVNDVANKVTGILLTWMQEQEKVFVIATANDLAPLPAQMLRRFDEIFFVDLPGLRSRQQIFAIHLQRYASQLAISDAMAISKAAAQLTEDFSGAEIEKAVKQAVMASNLDGQPGTLTWELLTEEISAMTPLAKQEPERIECMRQAAKRFTPASSDDSELEAPAPPSTGFSRSIGVRRN